MNGQKKDYIVKAEAEAKRVQKRLDQVEGVRVQPVVAILSTKDLTIKSAPRVVAVRRAERLAKWLARRPAVLDEETRTLALQSLTVSGAWAEPADEVAVDPAWFSALRAECRQADRRRRLLVLLALVAATPLFFFVLVHAAMAVFALLPH